MSALGRKHEHPEPVHAPANDKGLRAADIITIGIAAAIGTAIANEFAPTLLPDIIRTIAEVIP